MKIIHQFIFFLFLLIVVACDLKATVRPVAPSPSVALPVTTSVVYASESGQAIRADYQDNQVILTLESGVTTVLSMAISGSGARYTSGSQEWWEHQGKASYSVNGKTVFVGKPRH